MDPRLQMRIGAVARRLRRVYLGWSWAAVLTVAALIGFFLERAKRSGMVAEEVFVWWLAGTGFVAVIVAWLVRRRTRDAGRVVRRVEQKFPELNQLLLTASQVRPGADGALGFLQRSVIAEAIRHDVVHQWKSIVSGWKLMAAWLVNLPALALFVVAALALYRAPVGQPGSAGPAARTASRSSQIVPPAVDPGDTEIERGSSLIVTARFDGKLPDEVWLEYQWDESDSPASAASEAVSPQRVRMRQSLDAPIFAAYLYDVRAPLRYRVVYDHATTRDFRVKVFEYPALLRADAHLVFPEYTQLEPKTVVDTRRVTVAEGTELTWQLHLNKPVVLAQLVPSESTTALSPVSLQSDALDPRLVTARIDAKESQEWKLRLVDAEGRENPLEVKLRVRVLPNHGPKIRLTKGGDALVSPLEEFDIAATVTDDFAIVAAGIGYQLAGGQLVEQPLAVEGSANKKLTLQYTLDFERLGAEPNQLLSYFVWAEDIDAQGQMRRSVSDIFFVEVRPFEEIYRQGQQPTADQQQQQQGQQGNQQTEQLLELQKQIIAATWNTTRRARAGKLPPEVQSDIDEIAASQRQALQLLEEKASEAPPGSEAIIAAARRSMQSAVERLEEAARGLQVQQLTAALGDEQAAYQALLQLQSREHQVVRSRQRGAQSRSQRSRARQQQIDQLQLDNRENRYENERLAQDQQSQEQAELRQVMSRLRELVARQEDLNERLRELEAALQAAETPEERAELQRQLERLREQQQELLQDSDELQERMQASQTEAVQQAQPQMEQARENIQRANQSLQQGNTGQALAAGTRAAQQLEQLQDEVRREAASQFAETMQSMRSRAAELEQRQQQVLEELDATDRDASPGLRGDKPDQATELLQQQLEDLNKLLEDIQQTVLEAEDAEPLLAEKLYDVYQQAQQERAAERLDVTRQLLERSLREQGRELVEQSVEDLQNLREGIDEAAEAVLGSELESLRLALRQLETASEQIDREIERATGRRPGQTSGREGQTQSDESASGPGNAQRRQPPEQQGEAGGQPESTEADQPSQRQTSGPSTGRPDQQSDERDQQTANRSDESARSPRSGGEQENEPANRGLQQTGASNRTDREQDREQRAADASDQDRQRAPQGAGRSPLEDNSRQPQGGNQRTESPGRGQSADTVDTPASRSPDQPRESSNRGGSPNVPSEGRVNRQPGGDRIQPGRPGLRSQPSEQPVAPDNLSPAIGPYTSGGGNPITGDAFREWSDRLRDVEELVVDPELRWEVTEVRQAARELRRQYRKHAADPKWSEVEELVARPLRELKRKVADELLRRAAERTQIVPVDRDPVPAEFRNSVQQYYENLGSDR